MFYIIADKTNNIKRVLYYFGLMRLIPQTHSESLDENIQLCPLV